MTSIKIIGIIIAALGGSGGVYAAGEHFGFRPAYLMELREVQVGQEQIAANVGWITLDNFKRWLAAGNKAQPRQCAAMKALAKRLGALPPRC